MANGKVSNRSTGELLMLLVAGTICASVLLGTLAVTIIELINPEANTESTGQFIGDIINTLIGMLAGYLAGRTDTAQKNNSNSVYTDDRSHPLNRYDEK